MQTLPSPPELPALLPASWAVTTMWLRGHSNQRPRTAPMWFRQQITRLFIMNGVQQKVCLFSLSSFSNFTMKRTSLNYWTPKQINEHFCGVIDGDMLPYFSGMSPTCHVRLRQWRLTLFGWLHRAMLVRRSGIHQHWRHTEILIFPIIVMPSDTTVNFLC